MRLFWIILGILVLVWLGVMHFDRQEIHQDLDRQENRINNVEQHIRNEDQELNMGEEIQDETNDAKEEIQQGIPNKEEQLQDEAQDKQEELKEEEMEKGNNPNNPNRHNKHNMPNKPTVTVDPNDDAPSTIAPKGELRNKDVETSLPKDATSYIHQEAVVAFNVGYEESEIAFKQFNIPTLENSNLEASEAYLIIDPMLLSLK
jgi:chromosome segregation ATPase